jgi:Tfp pilus assembly protein PilF
MDGRVFRKWYFVGGLVVSSVGCVHSTTPDNSGMLKSASSGGTNTSIWGKNAQASTTTTVAGMGDVVPIAPPKKPGTGLLPDTEVQFANTHVEVALAEPPPNNRDELLDMARIRYQRALKQDPKHKGALIGSARMYAKIGDREKAVASYKAYFNAYPKDVDAVHELAIVHARWGDLTGAVTWSEAAVRADPDNRTYRKTLGFCLARAGQWEKGFEVLCRVMPQAQARHNLAGLMDQMGYTDASRQQLQLAIQTDPNFAPAREFLAELDQTSPTPAAPGPPAPPSNPIRQVSGSLVQQ